jgi:site-specific recombinase XerD
MALASTSITLRPLERLVVPAALDGAAGTNRAPPAAARQLAAEHDLAAVRAWLEEFRDSPHTQRAYRKEAERLLLWAWVERGKAFSSLAREDLLRYEAFLADPQPAARWCGPKVPRASEHWRPFVGPLTAASRHQALTILDSLFDYLVAGGYLAGNPLALRRRHGGTGRAGETRHIERFLDRTTWTHLYRFIETLPTDSPRQQAERERLRFLFALLYLLAPRLHEVASHTMGSFIERRGQWWWRVIGKGQKVALIPVPAPLLEALARYRAQLGLTPQPAPDDPTPLVCTLHGRRALAASQIYKLVKRTVRAAADALEASDPVRAAQLRRASTHWLRHTALTHQAEAGIELRYLRQNARHAKVETTLVYLHVEEDRWHRETQKHKLPEVPPSVSEGPTTD